MPTSHKISQPTEPLMITSMRSHKKSNPAKTTSMTSTKRLISTPNAVPPSNRSSHSDPQPTQHTQHTQVTPLTPDTPDTQVTALAPRAQRALAQPAGASPDLQQPEEGGAKTPTSPLPIHWIAPLPKAQGTRKKTTLSLSKRRTAPSESHEKQEEQEEHEGKEGKEGKAVKRLPWDTDGALEPLAMIVPPPGSAVDHRLDTPAVSCVDAGDQARLASAGAPSPLSVNHDGESQQAVREVKDVPLGEYLSFEAHDISVGFKEHFAVIKTADLHATLLVHEAHLGTHAQYELRRRVLALGIGVLRVRVASLEIIKSVHAAHALVPDLEDTQVESKAWGIINSALSKKASDIHIETRGAYARVYFRIHGERREQPSMSAKSAMDMCNVLYGVHADSDNKGITWDEKTVKDAVIEHHTQEGQHVQLRLSSAPIHPSGNFHAVIRLLVMHALTCRPIEEMGYTSEQAECIEEMLAAAQGAVLLAGPTNSGKSTSLQSFIERIVEHRGRNIKVITVERPVEYLIPHACQMGVPDARRDLMNRQNGSVFTTLVAATLRQDPDVVMVGEVNDTDSAQNIKQLVLSGRKTLSTLHVYDALSVFTRLRELGVPSSVLLMKGFISGVVFQRLVPQLCSHCSEPLLGAFQAGRVRLGTYERVRACADLSLHPVRVRGAGCEACDHLAIIGRTVCAEVLLPDETLLEHLAKGQLAAARAHWQQQRRCRIQGLGVSALSHAIAKMRLGLLDPRDIERSMGPMVLEETSRGEQSAQPSRGSW